MNPQRVFEVIIEPHVTEKTAMPSGGENLVVFKVARYAKKREIRSAVEKLFSVVVENVRTAVVKGKTRRKKNGVGKRNDWKKAYVRLADGNDIDFSVME